MDEVTPKQRGVDTYWVPHVPDIVLGIYAQELFKLPCEVNLMMARIHWGCWPVELGPLVRFQRSSSAPSSHHPSEHSGYKSAAFDSVALSFGSAAVGLQWVWLSYVCLAWSWHHSCSLIPPVHPIEVTWGYGVMAWMFIYAFPSLPSAAQIHM